MITINGVELRNLEEQVRENQRLIAEHYNIDRVLADFGIRIVGTLPYPPTRDGLVGTDYGDAYLVGEGEPPYNVWVWTRPDINSGHPTDYWLDIGPIAIEGPPGIGEKGDKGDTGKSTRWYSGTNPSRVQVDSEGNMYLNITNGDVYISVSNPDGGYMWELQGNIRGVAGIQGKTGPAPVIGNDGSYITSTDPQTGITNYIVPLSSLVGDKGERGDVGGFINIRGILANSGQLDGNSPASLNNLSVAYLIGTTEPYDLWIQVGETPETAMWKNVGPFNAASLVFVNGEAQNVWNADTKLDKSSLVNRVYATNAQGQTQMVQYNQAQSSATIPIRGANGELLCNTPQTSNTKRAVNVEYLNANAFLMENIPAGSLPIKNYAGNKAYLRFSANADNGTLVYRDSGTGLFKLDDAPVFGTSGYLAAYPVNMGVMAKYAPVNTVAISGSPTTSGTNFTLPTYPSVITLNATDYINIGSASASGDGPFTGQGQITIISVGNKSYIFNGAQEKTTLSHSGTIKIKKASTADPNTTLYVYGAQQTYGDQSGTFVGKPL